MTAVSAMLPSIEEMELTSYQLVERAHRRCLHSKISMRGLMQLWRGVGRLICAILCQGKGVRIEGLMSLTFDVDGNPMYLVDSSPQKQWRPAHTFLRDSDVPMLACLPLEAVARLAGPFGGGRRRIRRRDVEDAVKAIVNELIRAVKGPCSSLFLSIAGVGEVVYYGAGLGARGWLAMRYRSEFRDKAFRAAVVVKRPAYRAEIAASGDGPPTIRDTLLVDSIPKRRLLDSSSQIEVRASCREQSRCPANPANQCSSRHENTAAIVRRVKGRLAARYGALGLHLFVKALEALDDTNDCKLDANELKWGLRDLGVDLDDLQTARLIKAFDKDDGGSLSIQEFVDGLRNGGGNDSDCYKMNEYRTKLVSRLFERLLAECGDTTSEEKSSVSVTELKKRFNPWADPRVHLRHWSAEEIKNAFFGALDSDGDGRVSYDIFLRMYQNMSALEEDEATFQHLLTDFWAATDGIADRVCDPAHSHSSSREEGKYEGSLEMRDDNDKHFSEGIAKELDAILDESSRRRRQSKFNVCALTRTELNRVLDSKRTAENLSVATTGLAGP